MVGNKEEGLKGENFKLFLHSKGLSEKEYFNLSENSFVDKLITEDYEKFNDKMAEKFKSDEVNPKVEYNERFTDFIRSEVMNNPEYEPKFPKAIIKLWDLELRKWKNDNEEVFYSVDINNQDIGLSTHISLKLEEERDRFEKECYFRNLEKAEEKTLQKMLEYSFGYDTDFSKILVFDEKVIGRKSELIKFFKEELEKVDTYFKEPEKQAEERETFLKSTKETIEELEENNGKQSLEPVVLHLHSMDSIFHILNEKNQVEQLKNYSEYMEEIKEETKEEEEDFEP